MKEFCFKPSGLVSRLVRIQDDKVFAVMADQLEVRLSVVFQQIEPRVVVRVFENLAQQSVPPFVDE